MMTYRFACLALLATGLPLAAQAQDADMHSPAQAKPPGETAAPSSSSSLTKKDQTFIAKLGEGGMAEIQMSQLAVKTSTNADIKAGAQKMVDDHTKAGDELTKIAAKDSVTMPTTLSKRHQTLYTRLSQLTEPQFDQQYLTAMVKDHDATLKLLNGEISGGKDPELVAFAKQVEPTVQEHDDMWHKLESGVAAPPK